VELLGPPPAPTVRDIDSPAARPLRHVREAFDRSIAVALGINAYGRGIPALKTAVPDAEAIGALLHDAHDFTTLIRRDAEVTADRVRALFERELGELRGGPLTERDRLVVYFAGHGLSIRGDHGPEGRLLLADADLANPASWFAMGELRRWIAALPCRHLLIVLDCCFAGAFRWAGKPTSRGLETRAYRETLARFVGHRAWQVLVSASHDQTALDAAAPPSPHALAGVLGSSRVETEPHSPFATALLRGLGGAADYTRDGLIAATELALFVRDAVERSTHVHQTPQLYQLDEHDRGEFVFQVPGATLILEPAPALTAAACPYQGLQPYSAAERDRLFGRADIVAALVDRIQAHPLTAVVGPSGSGKSSVLAAGVVPVLRERPGWTVLDLRADAMTYEAMCDAIAVPAAGGLVPGTTLLDRITAWLSAHASGRLCLAIDHAEGFDLAVRDRVLGELAQAIEAHGTRLRVVLAVRSELEAVFRDSALRAWWSGAAVQLPACTQDELREIIVRPARAAELSFDPPSLVDTLINEVLRIPAGLPLLSFTLLELYVRCAERNRDRLLTETDYAAMGRLSGALAHRASKLLADLVATDPTYEATARRVFLRMVVRRDGDWFPQRVHRGELVFGDPAEDRRVETLLARFREARLVTLDGAEWQPAHDGLVRQWAVFAVWRVQAGDAFTLRRELAEAARRWHAHERGADLWSDRPRLLRALGEATADPGWLNARERAFIAASGRRRRRRRAVVAATVVCGVLGGLGVWDCYYRVHVDHYRDYVRRWGEPEGLGPLTSEEAHGRASSVKLVRSGRLGHVSHVELVHSSEDLARTTTGELGIRPELQIGHPAEGSRMPCQWDFTYEAGTHMVSAETVKDRNGNVLYRMQYRRGPSQRVVAEFVAQSGFDAPIPRGDAELVELTRSPHGLDVTRRYFTRHGSRAARNQDGVSIEQLAYNDAGYLERARYFDEIGRPVRNKAGYAELRSTHDRRGDEIEQGYFDERGDPVVGKQGFASWRAAYDPRGNQVAFAYFDPAGKRTRQLDGIAGWRSRYDEQGHEVQRMFVDEADRPTRHKDGIAGWWSKYDEAGHELERRYVDEIGLSTVHRNGYAAWRASYDGSGNRIAIDCLDEGGRPMLHRDGHAGWRMAYDAQGNLVERTFVDLAHRPTWHKDGHAGWRSRRDDRGNEVERTYLDPAGRPARNKDGFAGLVTTWDDRGNLTGVRFLDETGRPTRHNDGFAALQSTYDARGNETVVAYFDEAGQPTRHKDGFARQVAAYDERDNLVSIGYFDEAGQPTRHRDGYAGLRAAYDERGNQIEVGYVDEVGRPARRNDGCAGWRAAFDERGHQTEATCLDEAGRPTRHKDGFAGWRARHDERGRRTEMVYIDEARQPTRHRDGYAMLRSAYDPQGNELSVAYLDESGQPTRHRDGYASVRIAYDKQGNQFVVSYLDEAGAPTHHKDGYASELSAYDAQGHRVEHLLLDESFQLTRNRNGYAGWSAGYDARGNQTRLVLSGGGDQPARHRDGYAFGMSSRFDEHGREIERIYLDATASRPMRRSDGYAGWRATYDAWGNQTRMVFLNELGRPTRCDDDGAAEWRASYDARGHQIELAWFDATGRPTRNKAGIAVVRAAFDGQGNRIAQRFFDEAGKPVRDDDGIAGWQAMHDGRGGVTRRVYLDELGRMLRNRDGIAGERTRYDARGNPIETVFLDEAGAPVPGKAGYAAWRASYDERGNQLEVAYLDAAGNPTRSTDGYAATRATHDAWGNRTALTLLDEAGQPVRHRDGYAGWRARYDDHGNQLEVVTVDEAGQPTLHRDGVAGSRSRYDDHGNVIERVFLDPAGKPVRSRDGNAGWRSTFDDLGREVERIFLDEAGHPVRDPRPPAGGPARLEACGAGAPCSPPVRR
jgi:YD repeat-containing protein